MKLAIILGTRPEIIKLSPVIKACETRDVDFFILHTNQHQRAVMDRSFFEELQLPAPRVNLNIGEGTHGYQTGEMIRKIEKELLEEKISTILVQGDTNTVLAGSIAASKIGVKIGHVEAGLRSYDREMPEEINRVVADQVADYCFVPTAVEEKILLEEAIPREKIFVTGNTIVDVVKHHGQSSDKRMLEKLEIKEKNYIFLTLHRPENVDLKKTLRAIISGLQLITEKTGLPVIFPVHPRTERALASHGLALPQGVKRIPPVTFHESLVLQKQAKVIMTDSGGIQEEACILGVPCVTLRKSTERPQTVEIGANVLAGRNPERILGCFLKIEGNESKWEQPYGDGKAGKRIVDIITEE